MCKLYSVYEELPEEFLDETTWIVTFIPTFWKFHSPTTKLFELATDPTKTLLHSKCFIFSIQSNSSDLLPRKKSAFPKRRLSLYSTVWANFSNLLIKPTKYRRLHYSNLNSRLNFQKQKTSFSVNATKI